MARCTSVPSGTSSNSETAPPDPAAAITARPFTRVEVTAPTSARSIPVWDRTWSVALSRPSAATEITLSVWLSVEATTR